MVIGNSKDNMSHGMFTSSLTSVISKEIDGDDGNQVDNDANALNSSFIDQLHATQKKVIEELSAQLERYKKEVNVLRTYTTEDPSNITKLAEENHQLGEQLDSIRRLQGTWEREKLATNHRIQELENERRADKITVTRLSQALEKIELDLQRKEVMIDTKTLELEQKLHASTQKCASLEEENCNLQRKLLKFQQAQDENYRLEAGIQQLTFRVKESDDIIQDLKLKLDNEINARDKKILQVNELQVKLDTTQTALDTLRRENQKYDNLQDQLLSHKSISDRVKLLESEKRSLENELSRMTENLATANNRLTARDNNIIVSTLRSELSGLKDRLRSEFKRERDEIRRENHTLRQELNSSTLQRTEDERRYRGLESEILKRDVQIKSLESDIEEIKGQKTQVELDLQRLTNRYQELQNCRSSLAEKFDININSFFHDEDMLEAATLELQEYKKEIEKLKQALIDSKAEKTALEQEMETVQRNSNEASMSYKRTIHSFEQEICDQQERIIRLQSIEDQSAKHVKEKEDMDRRLREIRSVSEKQIQTLQNQLNLAKHNNSDLEGLVKSLTEKIDKQSELIRGTEDSENKVRQLSNTLQKYEEELSSMKNEQKKKESKLREERNQIKQYTQDLTNSISTMKLHNEALGDKIAQLLKQSKRDHSNQVALNTQVKSYKDKIKLLEALVESKHSENAGNRSTTSNVTQNTHDRHQFKHSAEKQIQELQHAVAQSNRKIETLREEKSNAMKRIENLSWRQDQMKETAEMQTVRLVEEIETAQNQLEDERKRCGILLANEKVLLRDLNERAAVIARLEEQIHQLKDHRIQAERHRINQRSSSIDQEGSRTVGSSSETTSPANSPQMKSPNYPKHISAAQKEMSQILHHFGRGNNHHVQVSGQ